MEEYIPNDKILENYAKVIVNFGLNRGEGIKKGQVVRVDIDECSKPILKFLIKEILVKGGHPILTYHPVGLSKLIYDYSNDNQLTYVPHNSIVGRIKDVDCHISIHSTYDPNELKDVSPKKIMLSRKNLKKYRDMIDKKENEGKFSWTLCLYPTLALAKEAGLTLKQYWGEVIKACFLNDKNPVKKNKEVQKKIQSVLKTLNSMKIEKVNVLSKDTNLWIKLGENREWLGGRGYNIPSFEVFISPDWKGTEGKISFSEKLYRFGTIIEDAYLEFKNGVVVKSKAKKGEKVLKEMIKQQNANKVGEFSLTDSRFSKITKFMADTLYDENVGGKYGNTHIALGNAYKDSYPKKEKIPKLKKSDWDKMGYNESIEHTDIVSTYNREVIAYLKDGSTKTIYKNGKFTFLK